MKVYIAGPINGMPNGNRGAFAMRAAQLTIMGHEPVNPWDIPPEHDESVSCVGGPVDHADEDEDHEYGCYLRSDIMVLMTCDGISLLPGWEKSKGASTEEHVAKSLGLVEVEAT